MEPEPYSTLRDSVMEPYRNHDTIVEPYSTRKGDLIIEPYSTLKVLEPYSTLKGDPMNRTLWYP